MGNKDSGIPKGILSLNGTQDINGKVTKTDFFNFLNLSLGDYENLNKTMTPEQALRFRSHIVRMKYGVSAAIPLLCGGPECPVKQCPCHKERNWPIAEPCIIESTLIQTWTQSYMEDLEVDPEDITELILVNKLVELDIIDYRANLGLSGGKDIEAGTLLKSSPIINKDGDVVGEMVNVHPLLDIKEKTHRMRQQTLESLAATRRERYKRAAALKQREDQDIGAHFNTLKSAIDKINASEFTSKEIDADWDTSE